MLPQRLRSLRKDKRVTQQNVADFLGITRQGYAKYESGQSEPDHSTLGKLVDYFDVQTDYLLGRSDEKQSSTLTNKVTVSGQEINLSIEELQLFEELKKHPALFHNLTTNPEVKVNELIKLYKMKKMFLDEDDEEYGDGFGELED